MKIILKVLVLPLLFIVTVACILGNEITNISTHIDWKRFTTLLSSENESSRIDEGWDVASNSNGAKARKFATKKATEVFRVGLPADMKRFLGLCRA